MIVHWAVMWGNPYTQPPEGFPAVALRMSKSGLTSGNPKYMPDEIRDHPLLAQVGYCISINFDSEKPPRQLSLATKQKIRRGRLKKRLNQKLPMFADTLYTETIAANPDYYGEENEDGRINH